MAVLAPVEVVPEAGDFDFGQYNILLVMVFMPIARTEVVAAASLKVFVQSFLEQKPVPLFLKGSKPNHLFAFLEA